MLESSELAWVLDLVGLELEPDPALGHDLDLVEAAPDDLGLGLAHRCCRADWEIPVAAVG